MSTKLQWLRECLAGGDVLCHATFWPWIPALRLHGCPFVRWSNRVSTHFFCSAFFWLACFCDFFASKTIIQSYMNHHESHPTVSNTLMTPRLRSLWWFLISANLFQPAGLLHLHQGLRRFSFEEFSQCLGDGGVDRFDDFEWLQTDAATAFLCVSCHVFSTWILSTQNI